MADHGRGADEEVQGEVSVVIGGLSPWQLASCDMERFFWICLGGAAGSGARYLVALWAAQRFGSSFPLGTLIVNLVGCFAIAGMMHAAATLSWSATLRSAITIGFIGGFTTYSSFNYETSRLLEEGATGAAMLNLTATVLGAFAAGWLGMSFARLLLGR